MDALLARSTSEILRDVEAHIFANGGTAYPLWHVGRTPDSFESLQRHGTKGAVPHWRSFDLASDREAAEVVEILRSRGMILSGLTEGRGATIYVW